MKELFANTFMAGNSLFSYALISVMVNYNVSMWLVHTVLLFVKHKSGCRDVYCKIQESLSIADYFQNVGEIHPISRKTEVS